MSTSCKKQKNACKICLQTVKPKNGIQCQGACESWVHYNCLNYTPGKIQDIENGVLHITCPCPDCKTSVPKEFRPDEPFSCNNICCPANNPPACEDPNCQANEVTRDRPAPIPPPGTLLECGYNCSSFRMSTWFNTKSSDPCMEGYSLGIPMKSAGTSCTANSDDDMDAEKEKKKKKKEEPQKKYSIEESYGHGQDHIAPTLSTVQEMCQTVGQLTNQINELMTKMKQATEGGQGAAVGAHGNVGHEAKRPGSGVEHKCTMHGKKKNCPQPCYCPGNPCH